MLKAAQWLLCTYVVLKLLQYFFVGRPGFGLAEPGFRQKLLRGEPLLFVVAFALAVPAALWSSWYFQRVNERVMHSAADCYGRLGAMLSLTDVESGFPPLRVHRSFQMTEQAVRRAAGTVELTLDEADGLMAEKLGFYTRRYATLSPQGQRQEIRAQAGAIERCLGYR